MEKCWLIKESLPIVCEKVKNRHGDWEIVIPKMTMSYDTFMSIISSMTHMYSYGISYNYKEGVAKLSVVDKGLEELKKMSKLIKIN